MRTFYAGQKIRCAKDFNERCKKGFETTVISVISYGESSAIEFKSECGNILYIPTHYWEPVDEKPSEDLFQ